MSHIAFDLITLIDKLPLRIECIDTFGNMLAVGTSEGHLLIYDIVTKEVNGKKTYSPSLKVSQKSFARKPITQITTVEEHGIIISVADSIVQVNSLATCQMITQLAKTRGCRFYCEDRSGGQLRLCVAMSRKLIVYQWAGNEFREIKEFSVPDSVKSIVWCDQALCVGFKKEYNMINLSTGAMSELFSVGKGTPMAVPLGDQQILLNRDQISVFVGYDGKITKKYGLTWSEVPLSIAYAFPYVVAVLSKGVEVRLSFKTQSLVQSIPVLGATYISVSNVKGGKPKSGQPVYVASKTQVWRLQPLSLNQQVDELLRDKEYEEALILAENLEPQDLDNKEEKLKQIRVLYAYHQFHLGQYSRAMEYFYSENVDPLAVIGLYPTMLPAELRARYTYPIDIPELAGAGLEKALSELITYLGQKRVKSEPDYGPQKEWSVTTDAPTIIDTALLKAYVKTTKGKLAQSLLRLPNHCHLKECERVLLASQKFADLILLYKSKKMHRDALELLQKVANWENNELSGTRPTINYLKELGKSNLDLVLEFSIWVLKADPIEALEIFTADHKPEETLPPERVVMHLKSVCPEQIIPFLEYVIEELDSDNIDFHNELVTQYFERVIALKKSMKEKLKEKVTAGLEPPPLGPARTKLLDFLEDSNYYSAAQMLSKYFSQFTSEELYDERAICFSKLKQHEMALREYVYNLRDFSGAERYCDKHYNPDKEESKDVYLALLRTYLKPEAAETQNPGSFGSQKPALDSTNISALHEAAFELLNKHYQHIDTPKALDLLPEDTPMSQLYPFFENVLRQVHQKRRDNLVVHNISKAETVKVKRELIKLQSRVIRINDDTICPICDKRIGETVFASYPNGTIIHYMCYTKNADKNVDPVTGQRFDTKEY
eukprot:TRINITY_DN2461_c0_g1_i1.p1 TRINITY_DN2461_c0_g1~~TRINITY_DN2461_c0_g1_i1.p1  ORF type:complete len:890 (+),score=177.72 TRINITY_DN2461_c0_g1_i1:46-2715(+)